METFVLLGLSVPALILAFLLLMCLYNFEKISFCLNRLRRTNLPRKKNERLEHQKKSDNDFLDYSGGTWGI